MKKIFITLTILLTFTILITNIKSEENNKTLYLTYDDGYSYDNTSKILDKLKKYNVKATFFVTGDFLDQSESLIKRMVDEGHIVGNHTWTHRDITKMTDKELIKEIKQFEKRYNEITNKKPIKYFRPPMGKIDKEKEKILEELGYTIFLWDISYKDYNPEFYQTKDWVLNYFTKNVKDNDIILLHTMAPANYEFLDDFIKKGYTFKNLDEYK